MSAIFIDAVTKSYGSGDNSSYVLRNASLSIEERSFTALIGPSGSGKSTVLNLLGGIDGPNSGTVDVFGTRISGLSRDGAIAWRRSRVGYVFQDAGLIETLTVSENIQLPMYLQSVAGNARKARVKALLSLVGLDGFEARYPTTLSRGQAQRVSLARALSASPRLLLCDEPTGNIDQENAKSLLSLIRTTINEFGVTAVIATHDLLAMSVADEVVGIANAKFSTRSVATA